MVLTHCLENLLSVAVCIIFYVHTELVLLHRDFIASFDEDFKAVRRTV